MRSGLSQRKTCRAASNLVHVLHSHDSDLILTQPALPNSFSTLISTIGANYDLVTFLWLHYYA